VSPSGAASSSASRGLAAQSSREFVQELGYGLIVNGNAAGNRNLTKAAWNSETNTKLGRMDLFLKC
jgi:hypothetical protein